MKERCWGNSDKKTDYVASYSWSVVSSSTYLSRVHLKRWEGKRKGRRTRECKEKGREGGDKEGEGRGREGKGRSG